MDGPSFRGALVASSCVDNGVGVVVVGVVVVGGVVGGEVEKEKAVPPSPRRMIADKARKRFLDSIVKIIICRL